MGAKNAEVMSPQTVCSTLSFFQKRNIRLTPHIKLTFMVSDKTWKDSASIVQNYLVGVSSYRRLWVSSLSICTSIWLNNYLVVILSSSSNFCGK